MGRQTLCPHHPSYPAIFQTAETIKQVAWSMKTRVHLEATFVLSLQAWASRAFFALQKIHLGSPAPKTQPLPTGISGSLVSLLSTAPGLQACLTRPGGQAFWKQGRLAKP